MQTVLTSEFKRGMVLLLDGAPQLLEEFHVSGTAQTRHKLHARLRHLKTGRVTDHTFSEGERVPVADVQHRRVQFSYHDGTDYVFSDVESFEEMNHENPRHVVVCDYIAGMTDQFLLRQHQEHLGSTSPAPPSLVRGRSLE